MVGFASAGLSAHGPAIHGNLTLPESTLKVTASLVATQTIAPTAGPSSGCDSGTSTIDGMPIVPMMTEIKLMNGTAIAFTGDIEEVAKYILVMGLGDEVTNDPFDFGITSVGGNGTETPPESTAASPWQTYQSQDIDCGVGEPVERWRVMKGIAEMQRITGSMQLPVHGSCSAVSCSAGAAIYACPNVGLPLPCIDGAALTNEAERPGPVV
jgi:hypothetical protein